MSEEHKIYRRIDLPRDRRGIGLYLSGNSRSEVLARIKTDSEQPFYVMGELRYTPTENHCLIGDFKLSLSRLEELSVRILPEDVRVEKDGNIRPK